VALRSASDPQQAQFHANQQGQSLLFLASPHPPRAALIPLAERRASSLPAPFREAFFESLARAKRRCEQTQSNQACGSSMQMRVRMRVLRHLLSLVAAALLVRATLGSLHAPASPEAAVTAHDAVAGTEPGTAAAPTFEFGGPNLAPPPAHFLLSSSSESAEEIAARWRVRSSSGNVGTNGSSNSSAASNSSVVDSLELDPAWQPPPPGGRVLVLGSGGLVGRAVTKWLLSEGYVVSEVSNRSHIDLRVPGALSRFEHLVPPVRFVMFLACDVGGAKFMQDHRGTTQLDMMENNVLIYQTVFEWIGRHRLPFLFSSTSLVGDPDTYGSLKRLGESWLRALRLGRVARLWNVYGAEPLAPHWRSHVLADWAAGCAARGRVESLTSGAEVRQFVHADDCAAALGTMMRKYDQLPLVTDVASATFEQYQREQEQMAQQQATIAGSAAPSSFVSLNGWVSMRDVGAVFSSLGCAVSYPPSGQQSAPRALLQPRVDQEFHRQWWKPRIGLREGIEGLLRYYRERDAARASATNQQEQVDTTAGASSERSSLKQAEPLHPPPLAAPVVAAVVKEDL